MLLEFIRRAEMEWPISEIDQVPMIGVTLPARFHIGHCHVRRFFIPWDLLESLSHLSYVR